MSRRRERSPDAPERRTRLRIESNRNNNPAFIAELRREIDSYNIGLSTIENAMADARGEIRRGRFFHSRDRTVDEDILRDPSSLIYDSNVNVGAYPYNQSRNYPVFGDFGYEPNYFREERLAFRERHTPNAADTGPSTELPMLSRRRSDYPVNTTAVLRNENAMVGLRNAALLDNLNRGRLYGLDGNTLFSPASPEYEPTSPFPEMDQEDEDDFHNALRNFLAYQRRDEMDGEGIKMSRCWKGYKPVKGKKAYSKGSCKKAKKAK